MEIAPAGIWNEGIDHGSLCKPASLDQRQDRNRQDRLHASHAGDGFLAKGYQVINLAFSDSGFESSVNIPTTIL
jgi:hypothetical protein